MRPNELQPRSQALFFLRGVAVALLLIAWCVVPVQAQWINEIHYDNDGTDTGEFIEVAGPANTDLSGWSLVLYNGANGAVYHTKLLSGVIPNQGNGLGALAFSYPTNGIQNGAPDGVALVDDTDSIIEFLCYEGAFTAVGGPADSESCTDIGVAESSSTPEGQSLQLIGNGVGHDDFEWVGPLPATPDALNLGQGEASGCLDDYLDRAVVIFGDNTYLLDLCSVDPVADGNKWTYWVSEVDGKDLSHWLIGFLCYEDATDFMPSGEEVGLDGSTGNVGIKWNVNDNFSEGLFSFVLPDIYSTAQTDVTVTSKAGNDFSTASITGPSCDTNICEGAVRWDGNFTGGDPEEGRGFFVIDTDNGFKSFEFTASANIAAVEVEGGSGNDISEVSLTEALSGSAGSGYRKIEYTGSDIIEQVRVRVSWLEEGGSRFMFQVMDLEGCMAQYDPAVSLGTPASYELEGNYPNPFNPETTIRFNLPEASHVTLTVYDVMGREVMTLVDTYMEAGGHEAAWNSTDTVGRTVASGVYLYRLKAGDFVQTKQMILMK